MQPTQAQIIDLLRLELEIFRTAVFDPEELSTYGWGPERVETINRLRDDAHAVGWRGQDDVPESPVLKK